MKTEYKYSCCIRLKTNFILINKKPHNISSKKIKQKDINMFNFNLVKNNVKWNSMKVMENEDEFHVDFFENTRIDLFIE